MANSELFFFKIQLHWLELSLLRVQREDSRQEEMKRSDCVNASACKSPCETQRGRMSIILKLLGHGDRRIPEAWGPEANRRLWPQQDERWGLHLEVTSNSLTQHTCVHTHTYEHSLMHTLYTLTNIYHSHTHHTHSHIFIFKCKDIVLSCWP